MNSFSHVPPGFRFHPTDEELVDYYLRKKINSTRIDLDIIKDVDLYKIEPWDLQELCRLGREEQNEWYFFSHKDKKYPTGSRTNRATAAGFWKATGRDKAIYSKHELVGMRKTLVFYKGRAPNGQKSDYIMHEYRLQTHDQLCATPQEEGWAVCRVFKKRVAMMPKVMMSSEHDSPTCTTTCTWYHDQLPPPAFMQPHYFDSSSPTQTTTQPNFGALERHAEYAPDHHLQFHLPLQHHHLPFLQSPSTINSSNNNNIPIPTFDENHSTIMIQAEGQQVPHTTAQAMFGTNSDWHKFVSSQQDVSKDIISSGSANELPEFKDWDKQQQVMMMPPHAHAENASTSNSSSPMDMWK